MKSLNVVLKILLVWSLLVLNNFAFAAQFEHVGGGFQAMSDTITHYTSGASMSDGPYVDICPDCAQSTASTEPYNSENYATSEARAWLYDHADTAEVLVENYVTAKSTDSLWNAGAAVSETLMPLNSTGVYFEITPEAGETVGDAVRVDFEWSIATNFFFNPGAPDAQFMTRTSFYGDAWDDIAITINDMPAPDGYNPLSVEWFKPRVSYADQDGVTRDSEDGFFMACIGDIIGIHLGATTYAELYGAGDMTVHSIQSLCIGFSEVPLPAGIWLLSSGILGLIGIRRIQNR